MNKIMSMAILMTFLVTIQVGKVSADFIIDSPLDFGEITVRSNNEISRVSINRSGSTQSTNQIYVLKPGSPAVMTLLNMPGYLNVKLSVDLPASSNAAYPNSAQFSITAIDLPSEVNTGSQGSVQFKMGGTLSTSGNGNHNYYSGATYQILLNLNLDY